MTRTHTVYRVTEISSGLFYIGSYLSIPRYDCYMGGGEAWRLVLKGKKRTAFKKDIIATFSTKDERDTLEQELIEQSILDPLCCNQVVNHHKNTVWIIKGAKRMRVDPRLVAKFQALGWSLRRK